MGSYKQYITDQGEELITRSVGGQTLTFTRAVLSTELISGSEEHIKAITSLNEIKKEVAIDAATIVDKTTIRVMTAFTNQDVVEQYLIQAIGLFAKDADDNEILFEIAVADDPCKMKVPRESLVNTIKFNFNLKVKQADCMNITVSQDGYLPSEVFYGLYNQLIDTSIMKSAFDEEFSYLSNSNEIE